MANSTAHAGMNAPLARKSSMGSDSPRIDECDESPIGKDFPSHFRGPLENAGTPEPVLREAPRP